MQEDLEAIAAARYPMIHKWLKPWLMRLSAFPREEYRVLLSEIEEAEPSVQHNLELLNRHLDIASKVCQDFDSLIREKQTLSSDLQEANREVLDKLAEVRAIVGLHQMKFQSIQFVRFPDLRASRGGVNYLIEVTRLGASPGKRADVWDWQGGDLQSSGYFIGLSSSDGKAGERLSEAIYREIEAKYPQAKKNLGSTDGIIIWISRGRDYLTAGRYELPGVGLLSANSFKPALLEAVNLIQQTRGYTELSYVVLSFGRDKEDLIYPPLAGAPRLEHDHARALDLAQEGEAVGGFVLVEGVRQWLQVSVAAQAAVTGGGQAPALHQFNVVVMNRECRGAEPHCRGSQGVSPSSKTNIAKRYLEPPSRGFGGLYERGSWPKSLKSWL